MFCFVFCFVFCFNWLFWYILYFTFYQAYIAELKMFSILPPFLKESAKGCIEIRVYNIKELAE